MMADSKNGQLVRLAHLTIKPDLIEEYKLLLKEEIQKSLHLEPEILVLHAVFEKGRPNHVTILETYQNREAYEKHITQEHFLKYKNGTLHMIDSLELTDVALLLPELKIKQDRPEAEQDAAANP